MGVYPEWKEVGLYIFSHKHTKYYNLVGSLCLENMILHLLPSTLSLQIQRLDARVQEIQRIKLDIYHLLIEVTNPCKYYINVRATNVTHNIP